MAETQSSRSDDKKESQLINLLKRNFKEIE